MSWKPIAWSALLALVGAVTRVDAAPPSDEADLVIRRSFAEMQDLTSVAIATWHLDQAAHWSVDQDAGTIVFTFDDGTVATAPVQIVGTYNRIDHTFLWGWEHPSVQRPLQRAAQRAQAFGQRSALPDFTSRKVECSEDEAWHFAAVAAHLDAAQGIYRGDSGGGGPLVYMSYGKMTLSKPGDGPSRKK